MGKNPKFILFCYNPQTSVRLFICFFKSVRYCSLSGLYYYLKCIIVINSYSYAFLPESFLTQVQVFFIFQSSVDLQIG